MSNYQSEEDINSILGIDTAKDVTTTLPPLSPEEQRKRLRDAQNVNRGHPRKDEIREELRQINVSCLPTYSDQFTDISLKTGKTKRTLLEEAIKHLVKKYSR
jgi:hypothetical protein